MYSHFLKEIITKNQSEPNVERMYARLNGGEYMLIQKYVFNKVFISIDDFAEIYSIYFSY